MFANTRGALLSPRSAIRTRPRCSGRAGHLGCQPLVARAISAVSLWLRGAPPLHLRVARAIWLSAAGCAAFLTPAVISAAVSCGQPLSRCCFQLASLPSFAFSPLASPPPLLGWQPLGLACPREPPRASVPGLRRRVPGLPIWVVRVQVQAPVVAFLSAPHLLNLPLVPNPLKAEGRDHHVVLLGAHCCQWLTAAGQGWRAGNAALTADS